MTLSFHQEQYNFCLQHIYSGKYMSIQIFSPQSVQIIVQNLSPEEFSPHFLKSTGKTQSWCCRQIFSPKICANHVYKIWALMTFWCISGRTQLWFWLALNSCCFACTETAANFSNLQNKTMNQKLYKVTNLPTIQHIHTKKIKLQSSQLNNTHNIRKKITYRRNASQWTYISRSLLHFWDLPKPAPTHWSEQVNLMCGSGKHILSCELSFAFLSSSSSSSSSMSLPLPFSAVGGPLHFLPCHTSTW